MKARLKKAKGPNIHSTWWCYIVAVLLILIYLLPIYIMLNLSFRTIQDVGSKLSLPAMWEFPELYRCIQKRRPLAGL